jgi:membrane-associated protein
LLACLIPIIRTFAPIIAGIGEMSYRRFISDNIFGGLLWTALFVNTGYFFGNIPFIKLTFSIVILASILISLFPPVFEFFRGRHEQPVAHVE